MKILDIQVLRGPNFWSVKHKVILARIDIGKFEDIPSDKLEGFHQRLQLLLPGLYEHQCSEGKPGGFLERVKNGTWIGHIVEHIALELQSMTGMDCYFGKTRGTGQKGIYNVVFAYEQERAGVYAAQASVKIAETLAEGNSCSTYEDLENLKKIAMEDRPGPSTAAIINAAVTRGIPYKRIDNDSLVQFGYGSRQKRIEATITDDTSVIAVDLASDKHRTRTLLRAFSIPVPDGRVVYERTELEQAVNEVGFPLVIKPLDRNQGKGVTININKIEDAFSGYDFAKDYSQGVIIENYIPGNDFRLLVINYKLIAAAQRTPAMVTGNDVSTVRELIDLANSRPERGFDHENILTRISIDRSTEELLRSQDITLDSIPAMGTRVMLKQTANLSMGGTSEDVTDFLHPDVILMAERVARIIGLDICGIDIIAEDITQPVRNGKVKVIEVNAAPGFRMHTHPLKGKPRLAGEAVIDMLFPTHSDGRIPVVAVTGTNGKTTTVRLIAHMAKTAGYHTGYTTTEGIYLDSQQIEEGDCTGYTSADKVLRDKNVDFAVLECARGGLLKSGLAFDYCDVGIVTNVAEDHIGLNGISSLEEMAEVKAVIPETIKPDGLAILNENDELAYRMKDRLKCAIALFSINPKSGRMNDHLNNGGIGALYHEGKVLLINDNTVILNEDVADMPLTFGGNAPFMIENIMAAILAAYFNRIEVGHIVNALHSFTPSYENTPGRVNMFHFKNFSIILDYAHNMHGITALGTLIRNISASFKIGIISAPGDRRDSDIMNIGKISAEIFNKIIIRVDEDPRGRKPVEIVDLLHTGIKSRNKNLPVEIIAGESDAVSYALTSAPRGSLIVHLSENIKRIHDLILEFQNRENELIRDIHDAPESPYILRLGKNNIFEYTKKKMN